MTVVALIASIAALASISGRIISSREPGPLSCAPMISTDLPASLPVLVPVSRFYRARHRQRKTPPA